MNACGDAKHSRWWPQHMYISYVGAEKERVDFVQTNPEQKKKKERPKTFIIADLIIFFFLFLVSFS